MVKIRSIKIGGFRNIKTTQLKLQDITVLVAANNFGKSNLITAIDFAFEFIRQSPEIRDRMMRWRGGIPLTPALATAPFYFDIELENDTLEKQKYINYGFSFSWYNDKDKEGFITDEWIGTREKTSVKYTSYLKREEAKYRQSKETASFRTIKLENKVLAIDLLTLFADEEISQIAGIIKSFRMSVCDSLDAEELFQGPPIEFNDKAASPFGSKQVPKIMYDLEKEDPERYAHLIECIGDLFAEFQEINLDYRKIENPSVTVTQTVMGESNGVSEGPDFEIPFRISDGIYRLMVQSEYLNQPVSIEMMSAGTKRIIWLMVNLFAAKYTGVSVLAVEEIETSIHPKLLKKLLEITNELSKEVSVLLTSHAPLLIQYLKPECLYIGRMDSDFCAAFSKIKPAKVSQVKGAAQKRGLSFGEFIFDVISKDIEAASIFDAILEEADDK